MKQYIFLLFCFGFLIAGCIKPESYDDVPSVSSITVSSNLVGLQETFAMNINFEDGDGDLGDTITNCYLFDKRPNIIALRADTLSYKIPYIEEQGSVDDIKGSIELLLNTCCAHYTAPCVQPPSFPDTDTVIYEIKIIDRAGNESEPVLSPPIIVVCNQ